MKWTVLKLPKARDIYVHEMCNDLKTKNTNKMLLFITYYIANYIKENYNSK